VESDTTETRILLVEDLAIVREGLRTMLEARSDLCIVGEAEDGRQAVEEAARLEPDIVVMDIELPRLSGIEATREIRKVRPETQVVILSVQDSCSVVEEALRAGASGYVIKTGTRRDLFDAVDALRAGRMYLSPGVADQVVMALRRPDRAEASAVTLTEREREILERVVEGLSAKEIASELDISVRTVETHRHKIMRKLGVNKSSALVRIAIRDGLVKP
jgi:two-component system, NarL family, response regulator NreC